MTILENMSIADNKGKGYGLGRGVNKARAEHYREMLRDLNLGLENQMETKVGSLSAVAGKTSPTGNFLLNDKWVILTNTGVFNYDFNTRKISVDSGLNIRNGEVIH